MMGQLLGGQQRLFYSFNLKEHVPSQHLLHSIDQCLDRRRRQHHQGGWATCAVRFPASFCCSL
ncbi:hypothetical protein FQZ97_848240 [compost metagenome]